MPSPSAAESLSRFSIVEKSIVCHGLNSYHCRNMRMVTILGTSPMWSRA